MLKINWLNWNLRTQAIHLRNKVTIEHKQLPKLPFYSHINAPLTFMQPKECPDHYFRFLTGFQYNLGSQEGVYHSFWSRKSLLLLNLIHKKFQDTVSIPPNQRDLSRNKFTLIYRLYLLMFLLLYGSGCVHVYHRGTMVNVMCLYT